MRHWLYGLAAAVAVAAAPASASDSQVIVTFDDLAIGTESFAIDAFGDPGFRNTIFGGTVVAATIADPAVSGTQVYRGASIGFNLSDPLFYSWPAVGAFVTGSAPITLTLRAYDPDLGEEYVVSVIDIAGGTNVYLGDGSSMAPGFFTSALFESTVSFTLDDLTLGLVDVAPGIPEPASWALMVAGFALAGAAARRRNRAGVACA